MSLSLLNSTYFLIFSTIIAMLMATAMVFIRIKAAERPTNFKRIILPPIFMSTGALMYIFPVFRLDLLTIAEACIIGIIFSVFLIKTTKFEIRDEEIYVIPSKAFVFLLFGLLILRISIKLIIGSTISFGETTGMFFMLAFAMILSWRLAMLMKYNRLKGQMESDIKKHTL